ncbi:MAG: response regulator [Candidatus Binatia bacterium]
MLIVDDNEDAADSLGAVLRSLGARVAIAYDGASALRLLAADPPDAVLLDIGMPGMDGYEVARQIRNQPQYRDVVLIALTGWGQDNDRRLAQEAGFDHHIGKPAGIAELRSVMLSLRRER